MILCLSPHLDDAILSCGAQLWQYRQAGTPVKILNLFTASDARLYRAQILGFRAPALMDERLQEEQQATALLAAEAQNLDFLDAPFRDARYRAYHNLMGPLQPREDALLAQVTARVRSVVAQLRPQRILAPLGVGWHVDHQLTHAVGQRLAPDYPVAYYEDIPYSLAPFALWRRLPTATAAPSWEELCQASRAYYAEHPVYRNLPPWQQQVAWWGIRAWLRHHHRRTPALRAPQLQPEVISCSLAALEAKVAAIAAYRSQFVRMFASNARCHEQLQAYARPLSADSAYAERIWHPIPAMTFAR